MKDDFAFKKSSLVAEASVGITSAMPAKGMSNVKIPGEAAMGLGIEDMSCGKKMGNATLPGADVKVVG